VFYSSFWGKACLRITRTPTATPSTINHWLSATISPRLCKAKPACTSYGGLCI